jgi:hypothetical protein
MRLTCPSRPGEQGALLEMVSSDQKKAQTWGEGLGAITTGPLNAEEVYQIKAVDEFADELERRCGSRKT